jgi:hypothetical protein
MDEGVVVSVTDGGAGMQRRTVSKAFDEPVAAGEDILRKERAGARVGLHMAPSTRAATRRDHVG